MQKDNRYSVLIWLLIVALFLSTGFNFYLVASRYKEVSPRQSAAVRDEDEEDDDEDASLAEELRLMRTMLARCQADHLRTDSLQTQARNARPLLRAPDRLVSIE
ncbi:hypothetical protein [Hymenobacter crusticola]|uniref:Uncharacterized protein n=1 Tax=Hymenobacter crusticola TaxID=1770526 RepID=A0A243WHE4_9BACT|nr:hypothetical protein [Hymenobacter crusticola]OUJ74645.1 hypothetical protein BXP70_07705 [Hymenobacter crusticola]